MNKKVKTLIYIGGFVLLMVVAVLGYNYLAENYTPNPLKVYPGTDNKTQSNEPVDSPTSTPTETNSVEPGNRAEEPVKYLDFTVQDYDGNYVKLSDYIGTPIVLNFWASWCPPCKREMPEFETVYQEMKEEIEFMMVDLTDGQRETTAIGKEYIKSQGFTFPVYFDTNLEGAYAYSVSSIPSTYFIDKDGVVVKNVRGAMNEKDLRKAIELIR